MAKNITGYPFQNGQKLNAITLNEICEQLNNAGTEYKAGNNITISPDGVISSVNTIYKAGEGINITSNNIISSIYTAGNNIEISDDGEISVSGLTEYNGDGYIYVSGNTIGTTLHAGNGIEIDDNNAINITIPKEKNKLLYSYDNSGLTADYLMYNNGLVVNNNDDFELCKQGADVSMATVSTKWDVYGSEDWSQYWGYCDSIPNNPGDTYKYVTLRNGTQTNVPIYTCDGKPQDYIFNTKNTDYLTGFYSDKKYSEYDSITSAGIINNLKTAGLTDYMAVVPAIYYDSGDTTSGFGFCGMSLSVNNTSNTSTQGREKVGVENHTISIIVWKQTINQLISFQNSNTNIQLLTNIEGQRISQYDNNISNGTNTSTYSSSILTRVKRDGDLITIWVSDPYRSDDDDSKHTVNIDKPIVVDLLNYTLSYTYLKDDGHYEKVIKDFKENTDVQYINENNELITYTEANKTIIRNIFDKLRGESYRGFEVLSNPGSIFRNLTTDELIFNMSPDNNFNTTWKYYQNSGWTNSTQELGTPTQIFTGSKLSFNRITNKLFYSDGIDITYIANINEGNNNTSGDTNCDCIEYSAGTNISIENGVINCTLTELAPTDLITKITYSELVSLVTGSNLIPGMTYRLINYECTVNNNDIAQANNKGNFDILITADNESTLNENVRFTHHEGDTYFSGCVLESWEGKYCIDNDTNRFDWADSTNGKGVIYWLKDEWNNECPYDFKNIQFKRVVDNEEIWYYTFTYFNENDGNIVDASFNTYNVRGKIINVNNNIIKGWYNNDSMYYNKFLNDIILISKGGDIYNNTFNHGCYSITLIGTIDNSLCNNYFGNNVSWLDLEDINNQSFIKTDSKLVVIKQNGVFIKDDGNEDTKVSIIDDDINNYNIGITTNSIGKTIKLEIDNINGFSLSNNYTFNFLDENLKNDIIENQFDLYKKIIKNENVFGNIVEPSPFVITLSPLKMTITYPGFDSNDGDYVVVTAKILIDNNEIMSGQNTIKSGYINGNQLSYYAPITLSRSSINSDIKITNDSNIILNISFNLYIKEVGSIGGNIVNIDYSMNGFQMTMAYSENESVEYFYTPKLIVCNNGLLSLYNEEKYFKIKSDDYGQKIICMGLPSSINETSEIGEMYNDNGILKIRNS